MNDEESTVVGEVFATMFGGWGLKLDQPVNGHTVRLIKLYALENGTIGWEAS